MACTKLGPVGRWFVSVMWWLALIAIQSGIVAAQDGGAIHEIVYEFVGVDGSYPNGGLTVHNGELYGITAGGGESDGGTAFKIAANGQLTTLHSFDPRMVASPYAGLTRAKDGNFYGVTSSRYVGIVLGSMGSLSLVGPIIFPPPVDPLPSLPATVYRITPSGQFSVVTALESDPKGRLTAGSDGNLYGAAKYGGSYFKGSLFRVTPTGVATTLHSFNGLDGSDPDPGTIHGTGTNTYGAGLIEGQPGEFFGLTWSSATRGLGTLFRYSANTGLTTLHNFTREEGLYPGGGLLRVPDGTLFGTTNEGGPEHRGTVFRYSENTLTTLYAFDGMDGAGWYPESLMLAPDGHFYGTNSVGAPSGTFFGTIFKMTPAGELTTVHVFGEADGAKSNGGLVVGPGGDLYGMTSTGGAHGRGTIFRLRIGAGNRAPIAVDDAVTCPAYVEARPVINTCTIDVLANDFDLDTEDSIYPIQVSAPGHGRAFMTAVNYLVAPPPGRERNSGWFIVYQPESGFTGDDDFTYTITDGRGGNATATVRVRVGLVEPPPQNFIAGRFFTLFRSGDARPSGALRLALTQNGAFSGQIRFGRDVVRVRGVFGADRVAQMHVVFRRSGVATLRMEFAADSQTILGTLAFPDVVAQPFAAHRIGRRKIPPLTNDAASLLPSTRDLVVRRAGSVQIGAIGNYAALLVGRSLDDRPFAASLWITEPMAKGTASETESDLTDLARDLVWRDAGLGIDVSLSDRRLHDLRGRR